MLILKKIVYLLLFALLFCICLINIEQVKFNLYFTNFSAPFIVFIFVAFVCGTVFGIVSTMPKIYKQKKDLKDLKQFLDKEKV